MTKTKTLNSLIHNLSQSYFSTLNYWDGGYMCDWIVNAAFELGIDKIKIDLLKKQISPKEMEIKPLLYYLDSLTPIIQKTLESNDLPDDFVTEAVFDISVSEKRELVCDGYTKGKNDKIYKSRQYTEKSYEEFVVFDRRTIQDRVKL
jgi:hypothetical protein